MKILIARTDRLGDTILSIPVIEALKRLHPDCHLTFLTRGYTEPLFQENPWLDELLVDQTDSLKKGGSWQEFRILLQKIKNQKFDIAIILHPEFRLNLLLFLARIPQRVAPASKIWQFLATHRIRQKRSLCQLHEMDYNLHLVRQVLPGLPRVFPKIPVSMSENPWVKYLSTGKKLVGIHPGSGGSARNWPIKNYLKLAEKLHLEGYQVWISYGPGEEAVCDTFTQSAYANHWIILEKPPALAKLIERIASLDLFIAGSTGPLHIAAAVGTANLSFFCPIHVCTPVRWGPRPMEKAIVLMPESPSTCEKCTLSSCTWFDCMEKISVENAWENARKLLLSTTDLLPTVGKDT